MASSTNSSKVSSKQFCCRCGRPIAQTWALRYGDRISHTNCIENLLKYVVGKDEAICYKCHEPFLDESCKCLDDHLFHGECLTCANCQEPLKTTGYRIMDNYYCFRCHWGKRTSEKLK